MHLCAWLVRLITSPEVKIEISLARPGQASKLLILKGRRSIFFYKEIANETDIIVD